MNERARRGGREARGAGMAWKEEGIRTSKKCEENSVCERERGRVVRGRVERVRVVREKERGRG
jgi:hypothetical protein